MATAKDVFDEAIALMDEMDTVNSESINYYLARTPFLLNILQKEVARASSYSKTVVLTIVREDVAGFVKVDLPEDVVKIEHVAPVPPAYFNGRLMLVNGGELSVSSEFEGELSVAYEPKLPKITKMTDDIVLGDEEASALAWGLARTLMAPERNDYLTNFLSEEYARQLYNLRRKKSVGEVPIADVYGFF